MERFQSTPRVLWTWLQGLGPQIRRQLRYCVGRLWLNAFGWKEDGVLPDVPKAVVIAYPHTTNWDLPFMLAIAYVMDLEVRWLGKRSLFRPPFGPLMRWLGGIAVNRSQRTRKVDAVADTIRNMPRGMVMIPPEGTRGKAGNWKSGFYWVAVKAEVPIVLGYLDFKKRRGGVVTTITPTGNIDQDMVTIRDAYRGVQGKHPDRQGDIALCDRKADPG